MRIKMVALATAAATIGAFASGCAVHVGGRLGELKTIAKSCPDGKHVAIVVPLDVRAELRGKALTDARLRAVDRSATKAAVCGGRLRVIVFSTSAVASVVVFDEELAPAGATENARLRRVDGIVEKAIEQIADGLPVAMKRVSSRGGDPVGQLEVARDYASQLGDAFEVHVIVETSGFSRGVGAVGLDRERAVRLADAESVPDLTGVVVTFAGLGRVGSGAPPSSEVVSALRAFYERLCERTQAASCRATSDIDPLGA